MRPRLFVPLALVLSSSIAAASFLGQEEREPLPIERLSWLEGTWRGPFGGGTWESVYTAPEGGMILSASKELVGGRVKAFEFERFTQGPDGRVLLVPYPAGKESVEFELEGFDPDLRKARFVNPEHDFPQELVYERTDDDRLVIGVFSTRDGEKSGFVLDLMREE